MPVDMFRGTAGVVLPTAVSSKIWDQVVQEESLVTRLGTRIEMPAGGVSTPTLTSMPEPEWVDETDEKPVKRPTVGSTSMKPYKMALIVPFSNEFRRDLPGLYSAISRRLPGVIAKFIDKAAFFGPSPGTGFTTLASIATVAVDDPTTAYADYLAALSAVAAGGGEVSAWVLSTQAEIAALGAVDGNGHPLWGGAFESGSIGSILGRPVIKSKTVYQNPTQVGVDTTPDTVGFAGEWSSLQYGFVETVTVRASDQATINDGGTQLNLWQRNMFALLVEAEVGVNVLDPDHFVRLTGAVTS